MKRFLSLALSVLLVFALVPVTFAAGTAVLEQDFESNIDFARMVPYNPDAPAIKLSQSGEQAHGGKYSLKVEGGNQDWHGVRIWNTNAKGSDAADNFPEGLDATNSVALDAGKTYKFSAWVWSPVERTIIMQFRDLGGGWSSWVADPGVKAQTWTELTAEVPGGVDFYAINNKTDATNAAVYFVDDIRITEVEEDPSSVSSGNEPVIEFSGSGMRFDFEDGTIQGFEQRGQPDEGATLTLTNAEGEAHSGTHSLLATDRNKEWQGPRVRLDALIEPGIPYDLSVWVKARSDSPLDYRFSTQTGDGAGETYKTLGSKTIKASDGWVKLIYDNHDGDDNSYIFSTNKNVFLYVEMVDNPTAEFYIDDMTVIRLSEGGYAPDYTLAPLKDVYKSDFLVGSVISAQSIEGEMWNFIRHHFNILTFENGMKPASLSNAKGVYNFPDEQVEKILAAGIKVHGHTLVWHQQSPAWLNEGLNRAEALQNMTDYISTVAGHYKGKVVSWDVVNEAFTDNGSKGGWIDSLRPSPWLAAFANGAGAGESGSDYIETAFRLAKAADPDATLYYNDFNLDNPDKADNAAAMVKAINDKWKAEGNAGPLIGGVGMQGHYNLTTKPSDVEASIKKFVELGVEISVTELDVTTRAGSDGKLSIDGEISQAMVYAELFRIYKKYAANIARVTIWGVDDASSWRAAQFPLLFSKDLSAKEAYTAVTDPDAYLLNASKPNTTLRVDAHEGEITVDGVWDENEWKTQEDDFKAAGALQAWPSATGKFKVKWNGDKLYVICEVEDFLQDTSAADIKERDGITIFIDEGGEKSASYDDNDAWYRVDIDGNTLSGNGAEFKAAAAKETGKYVIEAEIPLKSAHQGGDIFGFDIWVNDAARGALTGRSVFNDTTGQSETSTEFFGEVLLYTTIKAAATPAPTSAPTAVPAEDKESGSNVALIVILVVVVLGVAGCALYFLVIKKKK